MAFTLHVSHPVASPQQITNEASELVPPAPNKLGRRPGTTRQEDDPSAGPVHPSHLRLGTQA